MFFDLISVVIILKIKKVIFLHDRVVGNQLYITKSNLFVCFKLDF